VRSTTITPEGRRIRRWLIGAAVAVVVLNLANLAWRALDVSEVVVAPSGSSYGTNPEGYAAWAELITAMDQTSSRLEASLATAALDPGVTLVIADPFLWQPPRPEVDALVEFVDDGGRLILVGSMPPEVSEALFEVAPTLAFAGPVTSVVLAEEEATENVRVVEGAGWGGFTDAGSGRGVVGAGGEFSVVTHSRGRGQILQIADVSILSNGYIGRADNALLAINLTGGREVVFNESIHGFGGAGLWSTIPERWRTVLLLLGAALATWMIAVGRRFGPPEADRRDLAPERRAYVEALGALLGRARQPQHALEVVQTAGRQSLGARLGSNRSPAELREAALGLGLSDEETTAILADDLSLERKKHEARLLAADQGLAQVIGSRE